MTAIVSGAFVISSNRVGGDLGFNGKGWVISPDGKVLALTCSSKPFVTVDVDIDKAEKAKQTYPRNILE
jgi:N-carbamoylputrescine amidase